MGPRVSSALRRGRFDLVRVGDVSRDGQGHAARLLDVAGRAGQAGLAPGQQGHLGPAGGEGQRRGAPDPAAGPGHHDHLPGMLLLCLCSLIYGSACLWLAGQGAASRWADSSSRACTKACGALPRTCRCVDVVLLGEQAGRAAGGPVALEPAGGLDVPALLVQGQRHDEPAQQEGALGRAERALVGRNRYMYPSSPSSVWAASRVASAARIARPASRRAGRGQQQRGVDRGSSGARCQRPDGCRQSAVTSASSASASSLQAAP